MKVPLYAEAQEEILGLSRCPQGANTGLWYNKMCNKWKDTQAKPWTLNYADKEKRNKENQDSGKTLWIKTVTNGICGDANAIKITLERYVKLVRAAGGDVRVFKTTSRFVTGTGNEHPVENGFTWHHTLGTPFIPGSSVKGMMRCLAEQWWENTDRNGIVSELFGPRSSNQEKSAGNLIVFDALPIKPVWLEIEVMTPHYGTYYQSKENADQSNSGRQDNPPADWHSPIPIPFLTVASNQSFIFGLAPRGGADIDMDLAFGWLDEALSTLGAGAKTAAGYGCFENIETIEIPKIQTRQQVKTPEPVQSLSAIRQEMEQDGYSDGNQQKFMSCLAKWLDRMDSSEASPEDRSEIANHLAEWYRANKLSDWDKPKKKNLEKVMRIKKALEGHK